MEPLTSPLAAQPAPDLLAEQLLAQLELDAPSFADTQEHRKELTSHIEDFCDCTE